MKLIALDTATEACSAALYDDGRVLERYVVAPREHANLILTMLDELLDEAGYRLNQLDAIGFGCGPGAFTGLRIAAGVVQGIAVGADLPVVPISTLAALAQDAFDHSREDWATPCIDARMGEVYWAVYRRDAAAGVLLCNAERVCAPEMIDVPDDMTLATAIGSGWHTYDAVLSKRLSERRGVVLTDRFPRASCIARLAVQAYQQGRQLPPEQAQPVYLRDNVAKKPASP